MSFDGRYIAVVDAGSNSFHMIVASLRADKSFDIVYRKKEVVRLTRDLSDSDIARAVSVLLGFKETALGLFEAPLHVVATSVIRDAPDKERLLQKVFSETGIKIRVASGEEEARLTFSGMSHAAGIKNGRLLCIDSGGGSTEFIVGEKGKVLYTKSVDVGAVRLSRMFFPGFKLNNKAIADARKEVDLQFKPLIQDIGRLGFDLCCGTGGTMMAAAFMTAAEKGVLPEEKNDLLKINFSCSEALSIAEKVLAAVTSGERKNIPGLEAERADIIPAGIIILTSILNVFKIPEITSVNFGIKEGLLLELSESILNI